MKQTLVLLEVRMMIPKVVCSLSFETAGVGVMGGITRYSTLSECCAKLPH